MAWEDILKEEKSRLNSLTAELEKKSEELEKKAHEFFVLKTTATFNDMDKLLELQNELNQLVKDINELNAQIQEEVNHKFEFGFNFGEDNK